MTVAMLWTTANIFWLLLSIIVFVVGIFLTLLILIQDSKDTGLTSAFGGGGGQALFSARMQKDLAKLTAVFAGVLAVCLIIMGIITRFQTEESFGSVNAGTTPPPASEMQLPGATGGGSPSPTNPLDVPFPPGLGAPEGTGTATDTGIRPPPGILPPQEPGTLPPAGPGTLPPAGPGILPPAGPGILPPAGPAEGGSPPAQAPAPAPEAPAKTSTGEGAAPGGVGPVDGKDAGGATPSPSR